MKNLIFAALFICTISSGSFAAVRMDSVYYLLDTSKTAVNDRLWDIHEEYPSLKLYTLKCPCLQYDNEPSFAYTVSSSEGAMIDETKLKTIKILPLFSLISLSKQIAGDYTLRKHYVFFIIEPVGKNYISHEVRFLNPSKHREPNKDYITIPATDSARRIKQ